MSDLANRKRVRVLFHGDGDRERGTGHLVRALGLATDLQKVVPSDWSVSVLSANPEIDHHVRSEWLKIGLEVPVRMPLTEKPNGSWATHAKSTLSELLSVERAANTEVLITDGKYPWSEQDWSQLKKRFDHVISVDSFFSATSSIDGAIFPVDYLPDDLRRTMRPPVYTGREWTWVHPGLDLFSKPEDIIYDVSVLMGGADPNNLTLLAMKDLVQKGHLRKVLVLLGPAFKGRGEVEELVQQTPQIEWTIQMTAVGFHQLLLQADLTLCAFGLTAIELEYLGQPTVLYHHHEASAEDIRLYLSAQSRGAVRRDQWLKGQSPQRPAPRARPAIGQSLKFALENLIASGIPR